MRNSRIASRCCCLASRYWRIAGVADADICLSLLARCSCAGAGHRAGRALEAWTRSTDDAILALDTTTRAGSVALSTTIASREHGGDASRTHAERLPRRSSALATRRWLATSICSRSPAGPDRSRACGLASRRCRGWRSCTGGRSSAVSALEALAQRCRPIGRRRDARRRWMDAQRGEVFSALYRVAEAPLFTPERLVELEGPAVGRSVAHAGAMGALIRSSRRSSSATAPCATQSDAPVGLGRQRGWSRRYCSPAQSAAWRAARAARGPSTAGSASRPLYVRRPDAELRPAIGPRER